MPESLTRFFRLTSNNSRSSLSVHGKEDILKTLFHWLQDRLRDCVLKFSRSLLKLSQLILWLLHRKLSAFFSQNCRCILYVIFFSNEYNAIPIYQTPRVKYISPWRKNVFFKRLFDFLLFWYGTMSFTFLSFNSKISKWLKRSGKVKFININWYALLIIHSSSLFQTSYLFLKNPWQVVTVNYKYIFGKAYKAS